jgi:hypothetical protein
MPRCTPRLVGMVFLACALVGCTALQEATAPTPSASSATPVTAAATPNGFGGNWNEDLALSGEMTGRIGQVVAAEPGQRSECTGKNSKAAGQWALHVFGQVGATVFGVVVTTDPYRGPGQYTETTTVAQVHNLDNTRVWESATGDPVTFSVNNDEESGTLEGTLTNLGSGTGKLKISGRWSCKT